MDRGEKTPEDLDRPEGNSLLDNYSLHDCAEKVVVRRLTAIGYEIEQWGLDKRHDDGEDGLIYSDAMDFEVYYDDDLVGLLDVKSKSSQRWMGWFNERHYENYFEWSEKLGVPVFIAMFHVQEVPNDDGGDLELANEEFVFEIGRGAKYDYVKASSRDEEVRPFPDRNEAVCVPSYQQRNWEHLETRLEQQTIETS